VVDVDEGAAVALHDKGAVGNMAGGILSWTAWCEHELRKLEQDRRRSGAIT